NAALVAARTAVERIHGRRDAVATALDLTEPALAPAVDAHRVCAARHAAPAAVVRVGGEVAALAVTRLEAEAAAVAAPGRADRSAGRGGEARRCDGRGERCGRRRREHGPCA